MPMWAVAKSRITGTVAGAAILVIVATLITSGSADAELKLPAGGIVKTDKRSVISARVIGSVTQATACPPLKFFGVRGSGETKKDYNGYGQTIWDVKQDVVKLVPGAAAMEVDYPAIPVVYPSHPLSFLNYIATKYHTSEITGIKNLTSAVTNFIDTCPDSYVVMAGYSQGAQAVGDTYLSHLTAAQQARVAGIVMLGDADFNGSSPVDIGDYDPTENGVWAYQHSKRHVPASLRGNVASYCTHGDPVCNFGASNLLACHEQPQLCPHAHYPDFYWGNNTYVVDAGDFLVARYHALVPTFAYVANAGSGTVTPINTATNKAEQPIKVGTTPDAIAITPNGTTAYVLNSGSSTVTPINTTTNAAGSTISVGKVSGWPVITIAPNGATAYVATSNKSGAGTVTPINIATNTAQKPIMVGGEVEAIAVTPNSKTAYAVNDVSNIVTPINTATNTAGKPIAVGEEPTRIAITPNGNTAYVTNYASETVTPINTTTNTAGKAIHIGDTPDAIAINTKGTVAYVVSDNGGYTGSGRVTPINTATNAVGSPITVGDYPVAIEITPRGHTAYVTNWSSNTVTPISIGTSTNTAGQPIDVGVAPYRIAITPDATTAYVVNYESGTVTPINTATNTAGESINVDSRPAAIAITP